MTVIIKEVQRAIKARVGLTVLTTPDLAGATEAVTRFLRDNYHYTTLWDLVQGSQTSEIRDGTLVHDTDWERAEAGELSLLANWPAATDLIYARYKDDLGKWYCDSFTTDTYGALESNKPPTMVTKKPLHQTLVLTGAEHILSTNSRDFDPVADHALWGLANEAKSRLINIILIVPVGCLLSTKLGDRSYLIEEKLPTRTELTRVWGEFLERTPDGYIHRVCPTAARGDSAEVIEDFSRRAIDQLVGLSMPGATRALGLATIAAYAPNANFLPKNDIGAPLHSKDSPQDRELRGGHFLKRLTDVKANTIKQSGALEIGTSVSLDDVGGLGELKEWIEDCGVTFNAQAKAAGVEPPKGVLLVGPPGTGKTLCAKAIAGYWDMTLVLFDIASIFGSLVGESEKNMRTALATLEAAAPCVVLVDEIEKGLAGSGGGANDGGTSQRVCGTFLTWMQERGKNKGSQGHVIVVATANDITQLPAALLRKGRFDEIFYVDLPNGTEREEILRVHLGKLPDARRPECADEEMRSLVSACNGFVGSEIEQAIKEANRTSFREELERQAEAPDDAAITLRPQHIVASMQGTCPLSQTMAEPMEASRKWAKGRLRFATAPEAPPPVEAPEEAPSRFNNLGEV
jgi:AAA+ superfamily predicted ATPase